MLTFIIVAAIIALVFCVKKKPEPKTKSVGGASVREVPYRPVTSDYGTKSASAPRTEDEKSIQQTINSYTRSVYFGSLARDALSQFSRVLNCRDRALSIVRAKFGSSNMTSDRYCETIENAVAATMENYKNMAIRFRLFDDDEYRKLRRYKYDNIPDDIQEQQLDLYRKNSEFIKESIGINQQLIYKIECMASEIADAGGSDAPMSESVIDEINKLTEQLRFYRN